MHCQSNNKDVCTICGKANYEFLLGKICQSTCPAGYYGDTATNKCEACQLPCKTCAVAASNCTSCATGNLHANACPTTCPDGTMPNTDTQVCINCDANCKTCQDQIHICTSCNAGLFLNEITN